MIVCFHNCMSRGSSDAEQNGGADGAAHLSSSVSVAAIGEGGACEGTSSLDFSHSNGGGGDMGGDMEYQVRSTHHRRYAAAKHPASGSVLDSAAPPQATAMHGHTAFSTANARDPSDPSGIADTSSTYAKEPSNNLHPNAGGDTRTLKGGGSGTLKGGGTGTLKGGGTGTLKGGGTGTLKGGGAGSLKGGGTGTLKGGGTGTLKGGGAGNLKSGDMGTLKGGVSAVPMAVERGPEDSPQKDRPGGGKYGGDHFDYCSSHGQNYQKVQRKYDVVYCFFDFSTFIDEIRNMLPMYITVLLF